MSKTVSDLSYLGYFTICLKCSFGLLSLLALFVRLSPSPHLATWFSFLFFYPTLILTPLVFVVFWIINEPDKSLQAYVTMCSTVKLWNEQSTQTVSNDWFSYKLWAGAIAQTRRLREDTEGLARNENDAPVSVYSSVSFCMQRERGKEDRKVCLQLWALYTLFSELLKADGNY